MKKLVLLSLVSLMTTFLWATEPGLAKRAKPVLNKSHMTYTSKYSRNNEPKRQRSAGLQKVVLGTSGNLYGILNGNCHQVDVDSVINTVIFIHRSDTTRGYNVAQFRYDISKDGGNTWTLNVGPLNPSADNITIGGRYPEAVIYEDSLYQASPDSAYIVYNGSWTNAAPSNPTWQGQYYGVGRLTGNTATFTDHPEVVNNANVEIATGMIQSKPGVFWNLNMDYTQTSSTPTDTIRGVIIEKGVWSDSAGEVIWSYQNVAIGSALIYDASGNATGNNLGSPTIAFDPTGQYGYILLVGDITNDGNYKSSPILMHTVNYGNTWSTATDLNIENLPGIFPTPTNTGIATEVKSILEAQITVDSAGNPHIAAIVCLTDSTNNQYIYYPYQNLELYDIYYNPAVSGCSWQANFLANVFGTEGSYTLGDDPNGAEFNRLQMSHSKDGKKIFVFWNDTDSSLVAAVAAGGGTYTNTAPNLFGIGIDMETRKITNVKNFTAGDPMFGGQLVLPTAVAGGTLTGSLFPDVSPDALNQGGGNFNIPVVLAEPDYTNSSFASKLSTNATRYWYCQNIDFNQADFVNRFDNAPPTISFPGPDTQWVRIGQPYTPPTVTAYDCVSGNITPTYTSTVPTGNGGATDSIGIYTSTWTATNLAGNSSSQSQTVIVSDPPIARIYDVRQTGVRYYFIDTSLNFDTARYWRWGDGTSNNSAQRTPKTYGNPGTKMVVLQVWNPFGTSKDTVYVVVSTTGVDNVELSNKINVYPNPSTGVMTLELADDIAAGAKVSVINILGEQVNDAIEIKPNVTKTTLDLSGLGSGAYMLRIETPTGTAVKEISINK